MTNNNWQKQKLGTVCTIRRGGSPRPIQEFITNDDSGLNWLRIGDIPVGGKYIWNTEEKIKPEGLSKTTLVKKGDFILSNSMSYGRPYIMMTDACIHDGWLALQEIDQNKTAKEFLYYLLSSERTQANFSSLAAGSGVQNLKKETVGTMQINLPPLPEQHRIVAVLETWDSAIDLLKKKIALKKQVKKGLMQKLLTGEVRLPGFSGEWKNHELGELLNYEQPTKYLVNSTDYSDVHDTPVLTAGKTFLLGYTDETEGIFNDLPVIIFDDFTTANKFVNFPFKVKSSAMKMLSPKNKDVNLKFVFERMQFIHFPVGEHKRQYLSEYQYIPIKVPNIEEQNAIAEFSEKSDREITFLEQKLFALEQQKKFLLNNLVTGEIRTPEDLLQEKE